MAQSLGRMKNEPYAAFMARVQAAKVAEPVKPKRASRKTRKDECYEDRLDDLGESPDF